MASKRGGGGHSNDRFYEEFEHERKVKKRRARLITAAEEAFTHIRRMKENQMGKAKLKAYLVLFSNTVCTACYCQLNTFFSLWE